MRAFEMKNPAIAQIDAYWEALRGDRIVPLRSEIDPRGIDQALENAFLLERIAPNVARFRLAGMHLNDLMAMEVRGMPITSMFVPEGRREVTDILEHVFEQPAKARLQLIGEPGAGRTTVFGEIILLPLRSDLGDISRAIGCLVTKGPIGKPPLRFSVGTCEVTALNEGEPARKAPRYKAPARSESAGSVLRESPKPFGTGKDQTRHDAPSRPPYLRLVQDDD
jgi:hypothetical protein